MTVLRQLSNRNLRTRTFDPRHAILACLLLLLLVICFGLLYEVKPSSLKNRHLEVSPFGRKGLRIRDPGQGSRSERIEEKEERGEIDKLRESKVNEEDSEVGDDERDVMSDGEIEEEEELEAMDDSVDEEEEWEEEEEDGEPERDVMRKANRSSK
ncbi:uncharacterized protein J3R85_016815 [Psidium guajava]|nr:uncharacterized protein J3R85_016815 [Psidium guajava]